MFYNCAITKIPNTIILPNFENFAFSFSSNQLTSLPDSFTIPNNITNCQSMFYNNKLISLPNNFTIPNSVTNCQGMFSDNELSIKLNDFIIPNNVENCYRIFYNNPNLSGTIKIISEKITLIDKMSYMIYNTNISEIKVPTNFPLTDDEIKTNCGKSDIIITRF